ncbi:unnamed protein product [Closterium sp. Naga37s-1]|nr:unnamed protein product [Closterium sp. Naga37s-1]
MSVFTSNPRNGGNVASSLLHAPHSHPSRDSPLTPFPISPTPRPFRIHPYSSCADPFFSLLTSQSTTVHPSLHLSVIPLVPLIPPRALPSYPLRSPLFSLCLSLIPSAFPHFPCSSHPLFPLYSSLIPPVLTLPPSRILPFCTHPFPIPAPFPLRLSFTLPYPHPPCAHPSSSPLRSSFFPPASIPHPPCAHPSSPLRPPPIPPEPIPHPPCAHPSSRLHSSLIAPVLIPFPLCSSLISSPPSCAHPLPPVFIPHPPCAPHQAFPLHSFLICLVLIPHSLCVHPSFPLLSSHSPALGLISSTTSRLPGQENRGEGVIIQVKQSTVAPPPRPCVLSSSKRIWVVAAARQ